MKAFATLGFLFCVCVSLSACVCVSFLCFASHGLCPYLWTRSSQIVFQLVRLEVSQKAQKPCTNFVHDEDFGGDQSLLCEKMETDRLIVFATTHHLLILFTLPACYSTFRSLQSMKYRKRWQSGRAKKVFSSEAKRRERRREREEGRGVAHHVFCNSRNKFAFVKKKKENKEIGQSVFWGIRSRDVCTGMEGL